MKVARALGALGDERARLDGTIGFVPTMGALHEGHLRLIRAARAAADAVVLSIFVNPLQFGPSEDFSAYPRDERRDLHLAEREGVDLVWLPDAETMYPPGESTIVSVGKLGDIVEGAHRPGHFTGVATVVAKLFNQVWPDVAFFGQKDAQQVAVVKRMVADLCIPVQIAIVPTVRERDGLALSSRNSYLSRDERVRAVLLFEALQAGRDALVSGGDPILAEKVMWEMLSNVEGVAPDYAVAVDPDTFERSAPGSPVLLAVAARVNRTRLIDNILVQG